MIGLLATAYPAQGAGSTFKKSLYALIGASIATGIIYYLLYATAPHLYSPGELVSSTNTQEEVHPLEPNEKIIIKSYFPGHIRVVGHDQPTAHIQYTYRNVPVDLKPIKLSKKEATRKKPAAFLITAGECTTTVGSLTIPVTRTTYSNDTNVCMTVYVPRAANVTIMHKFSDLLIKEVDGKIRTVTDDGLTEIQGGIDVHAEGQKGIKISGTTKQVIARSNHAPIELVDCGFMSFDTQGPITITRPRGSFVHPYGCGPLIVDGKKKQGYGRLE